MKALRACLFQLSILIFLLGCARETEIALPFETIENADNSWRTGYYKGEDPKLVIMTTLDEAEALGETISIDAEVQLQKVDFSQVFAVVVFRGKKGSGYNVEIQHLLRRKNEIVISAYFNERVPGFIYSSIITSPYHLITIPKNGLKGEIKFILNVNGEAIIQQSYTIP